MSSELIEPDCMILAAVDRNGVLCACRPIVRKPSVGEEVVALLPRGRVILNAETEAALVQTFGDGGEFEARRS